MKEASLDTGYAKNIIDYRHTLRSLCTRSPITNGERHTEQHDNDKFNFFGTGIILVVLRHCRYHSRACSQFKDPGDVVLWRWTAACQ